MARVANLEYGVTYIFDRDDLLAASRSQHLLETFGSVHENDSVSVEGFPLDYKADISHFWRIYVARIDPRSRKAVHRERYRFQRLSAEALR